MDYLNNQCCGGGCFTGDSLIKMANGSSKYVSQVKKGDKIATLNGPGEVQCLLKFKNQNSEAKLCQIGGLKLTHKHPI